MLVSDDFISLLNTTPRNVTCACAFSSCTALQEMPNSSLIRKQNNKHTNKQKIKRFKSRLDNFDCPKKKDPELVQNENGCAVGNDELGMWHYFFVELLWTAPEQLRLDGNTEQQQAGDVYSYGIVLQEIVLREMPYSTGLLGPKGNPESHDINKSNLTQL